ncbi:MAG: type II toxin-antitoxin system VapC family toxin [Rhodoplanes sp.]|uniref:type II toxin-antitoxin system VapC family toxin n=1 Tax=Rhodoplanes sp. TaxID=1968906 RepID=UPI0017F00A68|nr:type II toxin-antitoxin system VapC family toxin [Rhodoplanes sp.]NVO12977.1 type II toxin-antitoxin system VapC family toxin [Rhodoplanes sp.]
MICLDTNTIIVALNDPTSRARLRINAAIASASPVLISVIVLFELRFGIAKSTRRDYNSRRLDDFLDGPFDVLPFDAEDAAEAGDIRATLEKAGMPIGPYDLLIAAQARRRDALLVTANSREFARVPGLRSEDWSLPA